MNFLEDLQYLVFFSVLHFSFSFSFFFFFPCYNVSIESNMSQHEYTKFGEDCADHKISDKKISRDDQSEGGPEAGSSSSYIITTSERDPLISPSSSYYGAIRPSNSSNYPDYSQHRSNTSRWRKTCTYIVISIIVPIVFLLAFIVWLAPTYAERAVEKGVAFKFKRASIMDFTDDNVIHMHISGEIGLQPRLFQMQQSLSGLFGAVEVQQSKLKVGYQKAIQPLLSDQLTLGTIDIPTLQLNDTSNVTSFDFITRFVIDDTDALMTFCKDAVSATTILWRISGPLSMNVAKLPWDIYTDLDKLIELEGLV
ncbi:hypothetical protein BDF20DRAFT_165109 [Mycotypha africana]|uniref:uncharacterized protein n=1 Tax=Mycotypha africana TaxID=64632 RepID=UPI002301CC01|nr:uncharacterized protein BDF20DRAFT_165109 [Mycotypha africana]KAI8968173.1 hypothetical protein BDF20DRAFT_165109 [Mycotypha africana]